MFTEWINFWTAKPAMIASDFAWSGIYAAMTISAYTAWRMQKHG